MLVYTASNDLDPHTMMNCFGDYAVYQTPLLVATTAVNSTAGPSTTLGSGGGQTATNENASSTSSGGLSNKAIAGITVAGLIVAVVSTWLSWKQLRAIKSRH